MNKNIVSNSTFTDRVQRLFVSIFSYHFKRQPIMAERTTHFGSYVGMVFRKAAASPLLQLLGEGLIGEFKAVEILVKNRLNQEIDDVDLESVIMSVRGEDSTFFILATSTDEVPADDYERIFRVFTRHQVVIVPLSKNDIERLEHFVKSGNLNACLIFLFMRTDRVTADPWDEKMMQKHGGAYATRSAWQEKAIAARLEKMAALQGPQLRTLIKKLHFLMSFEKSGGEIAKACVAVGISRKTFYLWLEKDAIFRTLVDMKAGDD
jgi:hypothetical protein